MSKGWPVETPEQAYARVVREHGKAAADVMFGTPPAPRRRIGSGPRRVGAKPLPTHGIPTTKGDPHYHEERKAREQERMAGAVRVAIKRIYTATRGGTVCVCGDRTRKGDEVARLTDARIVHYRCVGAAVGAP